MSSVSMVVSSKFTVRRTTIEFRNHASRGKTRCTLVSRGLRVRATASEDAETMAKTKQSMAKLETALAEYKALPPSMKQEGSLEASATVLSVLEELTAAGRVSKFGSKAALTRRNVFPRELNTAGIINPESIGKPSVRNDAAFLATTVLSTSLVAVVAGAVLPGELGFFVPYLVGGISIVVLAIGSTAPGLLQVLIDLFSRVFPDYRERMLKHEAGHFLVAYLCGVPITGYSLDLGKEHTDLLEAKLQQRIVGPKTRLTAEQVDLLAVISMAGVAAEGMNYEDVIGQNADLMLLQRVLNKCEDKLNANTQQSITRWAVWEAANIIKSESSAYEALMNAMKQGSPVTKCIEAIESTTKTD